VAGFFGLSAEVGDERFVSGTPNRSESRLVRDYQEKRREYRKIGVAEYWIIDRFHRTMTVYRLDGSEQIAHEGETYRTPHLPGFELPLARLLAAADRWAK